MGPTQACFPSRIGVGRTRNAVAIAVPRVRGSWLALHPRYTRIRRTEAVFRAMGNRRVLLWFANLSDGCYKLRTVLRSFGI